MKIKRLPGNPIIFPEMDDSIGSNINGPSLIKAPGRVKNPLGRYYLYFSHHHGKYIRLAYTENLNGPWRIYRDGTLKLNQTPCYDHIASPDVHIHPDQGSVLMYYHGLTLGSLDPVLRPLLRIIPSLGRQKTFCAVSADGIHFESRRDILGASYFRVFFWGGYYYALAMPGIFYRSRNGLEHFVKGPTLFGRNMRHAGILVRGDTLFVFYSNVGDVPEHILVSKIKLTSNWLEWKAEPPQSVFFPEETYEGAGLPLRKSSRGTAHQDMRELRDPYLFEENNHTYILYSIAGESGIAIAEISKFKDL